MTTARRRTVVCGLNDDVLSSDKTFHCSSFSFGQVITYSSWLCVKNSKRLKKPLGLGWVVHVALARKGSGSLKRNYHRKYFRSWATAVCVLFLELLLLRLTCVNNGNR